MVQQQEHFFFEPLPQRRFDALLGDPVFKAAQHRWGLHATTRLCAFRFQRDSGSSNMNNNAVSSVHLRFSGFHRGLLPEFLQALFEAPAVREGLALRAEAEASAGGGGVDYCELRCCWTTLQPFARLAAAGVVRHVEPSADGDSNDKNKIKDDDDEVAPFDGVRMPVVRRADVYLPHDIAVTDELRALFLLAHNGGACGGDNSDDDDDDNDDAFGFGARGQLSTAALRSVFSKEERSEFLYHILWRLVAGGGSTNQWDDELTVYLEAARIFYKSLVAIRLAQVSATSSQTTAAAGTTAAVVDEPDRGVEDDDALKRGTLVPEVVSTVVSVRNVHGVRLFDRSDDAEPSNLNYCYVCINPAQSEVVVWYHCF
ncbi:hypothetical protein DQ04_02731060 [Trypanosoma grayi]|uniref:hypothetical protein n=1 Tax=Trypanosoma grayi TaxID=71804 RepID=UPI0004F3F0C7|nr:hypothetical protein DQ04_02731060 [Trypanosoma grayi]KEG11334.1 hypothetical protein DQ04_02731060 [Trypanosoma grayi]